MVTWLAEASCQVTVPFMIKPFYSASNRGIIFLIRAASEVHMQISALGHLVLESHSAEKPRCQFPITPAWQIESNFPCELKFLVIIEVA
jgi:hypothetical protein